MDFKKIKAGQTVKVKYDSDLSQTKDHCGVTASMRELKGKLLRIHAILKENIVYAHGLSSQDSNYNWHADDLEDIGTDPVMEVQEKINKSILFDPNNLVL